MRAIGYRLIDDIKGRSAGLQPWIDRDQLKGPEVPLTSFENSLLMGNIAPAYLILENIHLVAEAIGLGAVMFGGYTGQVMLGMTPISKGLGFRSQIGRDGRPNPVGLDGIFEAYCPPFYGKYGRSDRGLSGKEIRLLWDLHLRLSGGHRIQKLADHTTRL